MTHRPRALGLSAARSFQLGGGIPRYVRFEHSSTQPKQVSPHIGFYKTFSRPIAKVLLVAAFTYQFSYWLWVKLEKDEIKSQRQAEISALEAELHDAMAKTKKS